MSSGPGQIVVVRRAQEPKPSGKHLEHALGEDEPVPLGLALEES
jgi:hypothetical protein